MDQKHIHSYIRVRKSRNLYMCSAPDCKHYTQRRFILGKESLCTECGEKFILDSYDLKLARPVCHKNCSQRPEYVFLRNQRNEIFKLLEKVGVKENDNDIIKE